jgi:general L-amino acid transport system substrate-binding protein
MLRKIAVMAALALIYSSAHAASMLEKVRAAGVLRCGINSEQAEYSTSDDHGTREAFDEDLCHAVGIAVLGSDAKVVVPHYPDDQTSMQALTSGSVEMLATLTDDFSHAAGTKIQFTRPVLWDGVGFLVLGNTPAMRARQLSGKKICFLAETGVETSVQAWFTREHLKFVAFPFSEEGEMDAAFTTGNCGTLAEDRTRLAQTRERMAEHDRHTTLLPETISKDPLAAATRDDDAQWSAIVSWVMEALVQAEESGVTRANVESLRKSDDPLLRHLLGASHEIGTGLGLSDDWVVRVIEATGNYGEIYERDLGSKSTMKLPRGENNLSTHGGLMMALPTQ